MWNTRAGPDGFDDARGGEGNGVLLHDPRRREEPDQHRNPTQDIAHPLHAVALPGDHGLPAATMPDPVQHVEDLRDHSTEQRKRNDKRADGQSQRSNRRGRGIDSDNPFGPEDETAKAGEAAGQRQQGKRPAERCTGKNARRAVSHHPGWRVEGPHPAKARSMDHEGKKKPNQSEAHQLHADQSQRRSALLDIEQTPAIKQEQDRKQRDAARRQQCDPRCPLMAPRLVIVGIVTMASNEIPGHFGSGRTVPASPRQADRVGLAMRALRCQRGACPEPRAEAQKHRSERKQEGAPQIGPAPSHLHPREHVGHLWRQPDRKERQERNGNTDRLLGPAAKQLVGAFEGPRK